MTDAILPTRFSRDENVYREETCVFEPGWLLMLLHQQLLLLGNNVEVITVRSAILVTTLNRWLLPPALPQVVASARL